MNQSCQLSTVKNNCKLFCSYTPPPPQCISSNRSNDCSNATSTPTASVPLIDSLIFSGLRTSIIHPFSKSPTAGKPLPPTIRHFLHQCRGLSKQDVNSLSLLASSKTKLYTFSVMYRYSSSEYNFSLKFKRGILLEHCKRK